MRLSYVDAIKWLNEHGIQHPEEDAEGNVIKDEATGQVKMVDHKVGDDIAEAAERQMTDIIGTPVFLHGFPAELKAFYMKKVPVKDGEDGGYMFTESCDLLMPNVGEIVGESFVNFTVVYFLFSPAIFLSFFLGAFCYGLCDGNYLAISVFLYFFF